MLIGKEMCEWVLAEKLKVENVNEILEIVDIHNSPLLKQICIQFVNKNMEAMVGGGYMEELQNSNPNMYNQIVNKEE